MNRVVLLLSTVVLGGVFPGYGQPAPTTRTAETSLPTLDDAVLVFSSVDKDEAYLGELVTLTLEFWELRFRGVKVQPFYRTAGVVLPETEGFFAGPYVETHRDATRNGALYQVTTYRLPLYPATSGTHVIGAWPWKGTVRGHTATGAQTLSVDVATDPIEVRVRPLPDPPGAFQGAVGEFDMALRIDSQTQKQGVPGVLEIELSGRGNPQTLDAPRIPQVDWFEVGAPDEAVVDGADGAFTKRFTYPFMPLVGGDHIIPPLSFTYFSPEKRRYQTVRTDAIPVDIEGAASPEPLVVIGGSGGGAGRAVLEDGRLPVETTVEHFQLRQRWPAYYGAAAIALPPLLYLVALLMRHGWGGLALWRRGRRRTLAPSARLAEVATHPRPLDALNAITRDCVAIVLGRSVASMTVFDIREALSGVAPPPVSDAVAGVLQTCQDYRYGEGRSDPASLAALIAQAQQALGALESGAGHGEAYR